MTTDAEEAPALIDDTRIGSGRLEGSPPSVIVTS